MATPASARVKIAVLHSQLLELTASLQEQHRGLVRAQVLPAAAAHWRAAGASVSQATETLEAVSKQLAGPSSTWEPFIVAASLGSAAQELLGQMSDTETACSQLAASQAGLCSLQASLEALLLAFANAKAAAGTAASQLAIAAATASASEASGDAGGAAAPHEAAASAVATLQRHERQLAACADAVLHARCAALVDDVGAVASDMLLSEPLASLPELCGLLAEQRLDGQALRARLAVAEAHLHEKQQVRIGGWLEGAMHACGFCRGACCCTVWP